MGEISAGQPMEAIENIEGYLDLINTFGPKKPLFCLRVNGDSMEGAGIVEDDLVIVRKQPTAEPGQIVAAMINGEALVKRLKKIGNSFVLKPENNAYSVIKGQFEIIGKVIGVIRKF